MKSALAGASNTDEHLSRTDVPLVDYLVVGESVTSLVQRRVIWT